jgi:nucleoside-diphosphate-sugar epimerase/putative sterol carrier protein
MKIAVTGAAGQLGTVVLRRLAVERGIDEILSIDLRPPMVASPRLRVVQADVRDPSLRETLRGCDTLIHLAFIVTGFPPRQLFDDVNVNGSRNVFACAIDAGVKRIVYSSSIAAYGVVPGHPLPIVEETARVHQRDFAYASAKFEVEAILDELEPRHPDVAIARLRPGIFLGAQIDHPLARLLKRRLVIDTGTTPLPVVWDEDVADAIVRAWKQSARGAFNVVADAPESGAALARACGLRLIPAPAPVRAVVARVNALAAKLKLGTPSDPAWLRVDGAPMIASSEKARRVLGWKPRCPTAVAVLQRFLAEAPARLDPRIDVFVRLAQLGAREPQPETRYVSARVQLRLTGRNGGDIALVVERGHIAVRKETLRPPTATVTMAAATFLELLAGARDFNTAQMTGKLRIEGEALAAMVVQGLVSTFRARVASTGARGIVLRGLSRWFGKEARP